MFRKLLLAVTTLALAACLTITCVQLVPWITSLEFEGVGDRFKMADKRYTVTANAEEGGKVEGVKEDYAKGEQVTLTATANEGYIFNGWYSNNGSCKATSPSYSFTIEKNTEITAKFVPEPEKMEGETAFVSPTYQETIEDQVKDIDLAELESYLNSSEGSEFLAGQIGDIIFGNPDVIDSLAAASQALYDAAEESGYKIELISKENAKDRITTSASAWIETVDGGAKHIVIDVKVSCTTPITDKNGRKLADFDLVFYVSENLTLTPIVSDVIEAGSYNIGIGMSISETAYVSFEFNHNATDTTGTLKDKFNDNIKNAVTGGGVYDKIKEAFEDSEASSAVNNVLKISNNPISVNVKGVTMKFDIAFVMNLDVCAALDYSSVCDQYLEIGLRGGADGPVYYEKSLATAECPELTVNGKAGTKFGIAANFVFELASGDFVNFNTQIGSYANILGYAKLGTGYAAAYLELGSYQNVETAYSIFSYSASSDGDGGSEKAIFTFGYKDAVIGYINAAGLEKSQGFTIINEETDISEIPFLSLAYLDTETLSVVKMALDPASVHYTVEILLSEKSNLTYEDGKLKIKSGAPAYFKESITVIIKPASSKWSRFEEGKMYVNVPAITVPLTFGDLDSYYDSIDTNVEKQFRRIYRSYNKANADVLIDGFEDLIESFIKIPADKEALYHDFTASYLSNLFAYIEVCRAKDDDKRTEENKFVYSEAAIFDDAITLVFDIMDGKLIDGEEGRQRIYNLLNEAEGTVALYNTLIEVKNNEELKTQISGNINNSTKQIVLEEIERYELEKQGNERALALAEAARELFSFESAAE